MLPLFSVLFVPIEVLLGSAMNISRNMVYYNSCSIYEKRKKHYSHMRKLKSQCWKCAFHCIGTFIKI
uniref:Putative secreted protein n=1 Tax=Ixodes ricinus TaxID=34613 RepID=A0A6B0TZU2_IXORI